jgi:hypothetical protein
MKKRIETSLLQYKMRNAQNIFYDRKFFSKNKTNAC